MKTQISQIAALELIAAYRMRNEDYDSNSRAITEKLIMALDNGDYAHETPNLAISGLKAQREREDAKMHSPSH